MKLISAKTIIGLFALLLTAACTDEQVENPADGARPIAFTPAAETRAAVDGTTLPGDFKVWGWYGESTGNIDKNVFNGTIIKAPSWTYDGGAQYWIPGKTYNFYGVYPTGVNASCATDGTLTVSTPLMGFGLFLDIAKGGTVCNLIMDVDMTVTGNAAQVCTGSIAGALTGGTIENCTNDGNIDASGTTGEYMNCTGGIVGYTEQGSIERCTNTGIVTGGKGGDIWVGGIAGFANRDTTLENNVFDEGTPTKEAGNL